LQLDTWNTLGANATPMAYTELFTGLQQGVIDGQENPLGNIALDKFYEVQKYLIETKHVYNPMGFVISKEFLSKLSSDDQQIIKEAALQAGNFQRQLNLEKNEEFRQILIDNGMEIIELSQEDYDGFVEKVQVVYDEYKDIIGEENLKEFCQERLAGFKVPKLFVVTDNLPKNPSGKILKRELREQYEDLAKNLN